MEEVEGQVALFFHCLNQKRGTKTVRFCVVSGGSVCLGSTPWGLFKNKEAEVMFVSSSSLGSCCACFTAQLKGAPLLLGRDPCMVCSSGESTEPVGKVPGTGTAEGPSLPYCCSTADLSAWGLLQIMWPRGVCPRHRHPRQVPVAQVEP